MIGATAYTPDVKLDQLA